jgi:hypothetical protein
MIGSVMASCMVLSRANVEDIRMLRVGRAALNGKIKMIQVLKIKFKREP